MPAIRRPFLALVLLTLFLAPLVLAPAVSADQHEPPGEPDPAEPKPPIEWDKARPLTWEDFAGPVPPTAPEDIDAAAVSGTSFKWSFTGPCTFNAKSKKWTCTLGKLTFTAIAVFDPNTSWVRPGGQTAELLKHEQLHFDISEIFAREKRKEMAKLAKEKLKGMGATAQAATTDLENKLKARIKKICDKIKKKEDAMQTKYDKETDHGRKAAEQAKWEAKVARLLK